MPKIAGILTFYTGVAVEVEEIKLETKEELEEVLRKYAEEKYPNCTLTEIKFLTMPESGKGKVINWKGR